MPRHAPLFLATLALALLAVAPPAHAMTWFPCPLFPDTPPSAKQSTLQPSSLAHRLFEPLTSPLSPAFIPELEFHASAAPSAVSTVSECATFQAPLFYEPSESPTTIPVFVQRLRSTATLGQPRKVLTLLSGGPGDDSAFFAHPAQLLTGLLGDGWDVMWLDHRGVGSSARLYCRASGVETVGSQGGVSITAGETQECANEVNLRFNEYFQYFTINNAAHDVHKLLTQVKVEESYSRMFVYGLSYGTAWAQRLVTLHPDVADGVVLDGVVTLAGPAGVRLTFDTYDSELAAVVDTFMDKCAVDDKCRSYLGDDPRGKMRSTIDRVFNDGHCAEAIGALGIDRKTLVEQFGGFSTNYDRRVFIPAIIFRLDRCNKGDVKFFKHLAAAQAAIPNDPPMCASSRSQLLQNMIGVAELWDFDRTLAGIQTVENSLYATAGFSPEFARTQQVWPPYPRSTVFNTTLFSLNTPIALFSGTLDPQTPHHFAEATNAALEGRVRSHQLVTFPNSPHGTLMRSPTPQTKTTGVHCAMTVLVSFLKSDGATLDQSCLADLLPLTFTGDKNVNLAFAGVSDVYNGVPPATSPSDPSCGDDGGNTISKSTFDGVVATLSMALIVTLAYLYNQRSKVIQLQLESDSIGLGSTTSYERL